MPDVRNSFIKAPAVVFAYSRKKLSPSSIERYHFLASFPGLPAVQFLIACSAFCILQAIKNWTVGRPGIRNFPVTHSMLRKLRLLIFYHTNFQWKMQSAPLVLHRLVRYKYLREDHLMVQLWYDLPVVTRSHSGERAVSSTSGLRYPRESQVM